MHGRLMIQESCFILCFFHSCRLLCENIQRTCQAVCTAVSVQSTPAVLLLARTIPDMSWVSSGQLREAEAGSEAEGSTQGS